MGIAYKRSVLTDVLVIENTYITEKPAEPKILTSQSDGLCFSTERIWLYFKLLVPKSFFKVSLSGSNTILIGALSTNTAKVMVNSDDT